MDYSLPKILGDGWMNHTTVENERIVSEGECL